MNGDRDELARAVRPVLFEYGAWGTVPPSHPLGVPEWGDSLASEDSDCPEAIADAVWDAGWRKKPSREELIVTLAKAVHKASGVILHPKSEDFVADAVLALMDGPTETGEK